MHSKPPTADDGVGAAPFVHHLADCQTTDLGQGTRVWQFSVVLAGAKVGRDCNINCHCFVENDVVIGDRVTVKAGVYLWNGMRIEDDVFIGPNVTFTNDKVPRSRRWPAAFPTTRVCEGASIGAGAIVLPGVTIGRHALVGAGSLVTKDVAPFTVVVGAPARFLRTIDAPPA